VKRSILARNLATGKVLVFENAMDASREYGFDESHIIKCCRGRRKQHKGYAWSYHLPIKSLEDTIKERAWSFKEDMLIKKYFKSGNLESLLSSLMGRNFRDLMCRAQILGLKRNNTPAKNVTPYDLIYELAEDVLFEDN